MEIKVQTKRYTKQIRNVTNANLTVYDFEIGIVTSDYWGRFEERKEPLVTLSISGNSYEYPLPEFLSRLNIKRKKDGHLLKKRK